MKTTIRRAPVAATNLAAILLLVASAAPASAIGGQRPGIHDLAGRWSFRVVRTGGDPDAAAWRPAALPAAVSTLGITSGEETLWLRCEVELGDGWERRLAPSGLAVSIANTFYGNYEIFAAGRSIGTWQGPFPGIAPPPPRVFSVPHEAVGKGGRLRLTLRWQWSGWPSRRIVRQEGLMGDGWILGDRRRLLDRAELRKFQGLNADLPLMVLALLYAAIGAYHLQLFRRDRRCEEYLWFGLTAGVVAFNTLLITHWIAGFVDHYVAIRRLFDITGALMVASSIQFLWPFLSRPIGRLLRTYQLSFLVLAVLVAVLPESGWAFGLETFSKVWSIPFLPAVAVLVFSEIRRGNPEARTIALGGLAVVVAGGLEMASQIRGLGTTYPLPAVAFTFFALSMAFSLSNRFSRVHDELDALRRQLEEMVEDRIGELSLANDRLQSQIAERELAQEAMRMLERAVEQSIDGILVTDLEESTFFVNEEWGRMHGREAFEILGSRLELFHSREQMEKEVRPALATVRREGSWGGEICHRRKDGSEFPTWMSITMLRDTARQPVGFVAVARDITDRRQAAEDKLRIEARLREAGKLTSLADLAGGIAHDYNNLLTGVLGNSSLALAELPPSSLASEKLQQIGVAAERAADLTTQLLTYAGAETPATREIDLNDLISGSQDEWTRAVGGEARFAVELVPGLPLVEADPAQLRRALLNLLANAAESTAEAGGGVVTVETGWVRDDAGYFSGAYPNEDLPPGSYVLLRVTDRGKGIDASSRPRIFDPFFSTKTAARGLGLATVLSIVRAHRGTIKVESRPGMGAAFELLFPAVGGAESGESDSVSQRPYRWRGSGAVLVIDDEQIMREVSRSILEQSGFKVFATGEGQRGLELYQQYMATIRVILLDRTMPRMSGVEVLDRIRDLNPQAQVVMMSGYQRDAIVGELRARGVTDFLPKPFRPQELLDKVRSVLDREA